MQRAIDIIQDEMPKRDVLKKIREFQVTAQVERQMAKHGKALNKSKKRQEASDGIYTLRCLKCDNFAVYSTDVRTIENSHHVVIDDDFERRIKIRPHPNPKKWENLKLTGAIFCNKCHIPWGIKGVHNKVAFPIIKIANFVITDEFDRRDTCKKWKDAPFSVEPLTPADLSNFVAESSSDDEDFGF